MGAPVRIKAAIYILSFCISTMALLGTLSYSQNTISNQVTNTANTSTTTIYANSLNSTTSNTQTSISTSTTSITTTTSTTSIPTNPTTFKESGIPNGYTWNVSYNGVVKGTVSPSSIQFPIYTGNYMFTVWAPTQNGITFTPSPANGYLKAGSNLTITFNSVLPGTSSSTTTTATTSSSTTTIPANVYTTFTENGLPANAVWSISYNYTTMNTVVQGPLTFGDPPGNYPFAAQPVRLLNSTYLPTPSNGMLMAGSTINIAYALRSYGNTTTSLTTTTSNTTTGSTPTTTSVNIVRTSNLSVRIPVSPRISYVTNPATNVTVLNSTIQSYIASQVGSITGGAAYEGNATPSFSNLTPLSNSQVSKFYAAAGSLAAQFPLAAGSFNISTQNVTLAYGSLRVSGAPAAAGGAYRFAQSNKYTGSFKVYNVKVVKATPPLTLTINGRTVQQSKNTTVEVIHVPVVNGQVGLSGNRYYALNVSMSASLLNSLPMNYSVVAGNGVTLYSGSTDAASLSKTLNYLLPANQQVFIDLSSAGNSNYTYADPLVEIIPTNILFYVPITLTNSQSVNTAAPFQQMLSVNSLAYSSYEAATLDNIEFFYSNGTLINSWLEGNNIATEAAGASSSSTNTIYWLSISGGISASSSANVYMGFASTSSSLFDGVTTGEAPWLSSTYAEYDNGAQVFPLYFNGDTPTSDFGAISGVTVTQSTGVAYGSSTINAIKTSGGPANVNAQWVYKTASVSAQGVIAESNFEGTTFANFGEIGIGDSSTAGSLENGISNAGHISSKLYAPLSDASGTTTTGTKTGTIAASTWYWATLIYPGTSASSFDVVTDTVPEYESASAVVTLAKNPLSSSTSFYIAPPSQHTGTGTYDILYNLVRVRYYPPNGVMPAVSFGAVYGVATFTENGLPNSGEKWNVTYGGNTINAIVPNSIVFSVVPGSYAYTVPDVSVGANTYVPLQPSGSVSAGNTVAVTFILSGCGVLPPALSNLTNGCIPVTVGNTVGSPGRFQAMLTFNGLAYSNYVATTATNIYLYNSLSGNVIPLWLEAFNSANELVSNGLTANMIFWANVPDTISQSSSDTNLYFGIGPQSTNFMANANASYGAAPQLFCASGCPQTSYAEYDNGAAVFSAYTNFAGNSVQPGWVEGTYNVIPIIDNGLRVTLGNNQQFAFTTAANSLPYPVISDAFVSNFVITVGSPSIVALAETLTNSVASCAGVGCQNLEGNGYAMTTFTASGTANILLAQSLGGNLGAVGTAVPSSGGVDSFVWNTGALTGYASYSNVISAANTVFSIANYYLSVGAGSGPNGAGTVDYQWFRGREYPPSGIQPQVTFGPTLSPAGSPTLTYSSGNAVTYSQLNIVTATCRPNSDNCAIWLGSTQLANAIGSVTYNATLLGAGSYAFYANDLSSSMTSNINVLSVLRATPIITLPNFPASCIAPCSGTLTANVQTINNQLSVTDYLNGVPVNTFFTQNSVSESAVGSYNFSVNTTSRTGTANYVYGANQMTFRISIPDLNIPWNPAQYLRNNTISVNAISGSDTVNLVISNSIQLVSLSGTGSVSYLENSLWVGTYNVIGCDQTIGACTTQVLTVEPDKETGWIANANDIVSLNVVGMSPTLFNQTLNNSCSFVGIDLGAPAQPFSKAYQMVSGVNGFYGYVGNYTGWVTNSIVANGLLPSYVTAAMYDPEYTAPFNTPLIEQKNPWNYTYKFSNWTRLNPPHSILLAAPALDLLQGIPHNGTNAQGYLQINMSGHVSQYADAFDIQAQSQQAIVGNYMSFVRAASLQALSAPRGVWPAPSGSTFNANPTNSLLFLYAGLTSTNEGGVTTTPNELFTDARAVRFNVSGFWLNSPSGKNNTVIPEFVQLWDNTTTLYSESGLPSGTKWTVNRTCYAGRTQNTQMTFNTPPGIYTWTAPNVVVNGITYAPLTPSGNALAGTTVNIIYSSTSCQISLSTNALSFGAVIASHAYNTNQVVTDTNNGPAASFLWINGGNWIGGGNSFGVGNTLWNPTSDSSYKGNALTSATSNTNILVPGSGGSNSIYFGLGVPAGQPANVYSQNIIITNVC